MAKHLRRSLRIQLRAVPLEAVAAAKERRDAGAIDVVPASSSSIQYNIVDVLIGCSHAVSLDASIFDIFVFPTCQK